MPLPCVVAVAEGFKVAQGVPGWVGGTEDVIGAGGGVLPAQAPD